MRKLLPVGIALLAAGSLALSACSAVSATSGTGTTSAHTSAPVQTGTPGDAARVEAPNPALPVFTAAPRSNGTVPPEIHAASAVVLDEASGSVLYALNGHLRLPPASLTKIATAAITIQAGELGRLVTVHPDLERELEDDSSTMGLEPGDQFSRLELLYGLMLVSGNDAAEALAEDTAGTADAFVGRMNDLARVLGLADTHFTDPHGLGNADEFSSAYDMALLARYAMSFDVFRTIVGSETHTATGSRNIDLVNLNPLLGYTPGVDGVKTGFTEQAGRTYVVSAARGGHRIYVVLFNTAFRAQDAIALIEWAFAGFTWA